ncbi:unnamed protein product [Phytophthora fragariaefolia]|uniref:Unnamed protein product n=1 Tax=Phytophthora fragariaefolia TaxID=1490495 RepID=A0A9W6Y2S5_9STRA|nr:unnamed protein product [Phytophthora fragariaefolia]
MLVVQNAIESAGFHHDPQNWFIWNHDVYGWKFQRAWTQHEEEESKSGDVEDEAQENDDVFNLAKVDCAWDDIDLIDSGAGWCSETHWLTLGWENLSQAQPRHAALYKRFKAEGFAHGEICAQIAGDSRATADDAGTIQQFNAH